MLCLSLLALVTIVLAQADCPYGPDTCVQGKFISVLFPSRGDYTNQHPIQVMFGVKPIPMTMSASLPGLDRRPLRTMPQLPNEYPQTAAHTALTLAFKATCGGRPARQITFA